MTVAIQDCVSGGAKAALCGAGAGHAHVAVRGPCLHGAAYFFSAVRGGITMGFPTAYGVEPLKSKVLFADETPPA